MAYIKYGVQERNVKLKLDKKLHGHTIISSNEYHAFLLLRKPLDVFKKVVLRYCPWDNDIIAFLHLPVGTLVHYDPKDIKLRCNFAIVMGFNKDVSQCRSVYDRSFVYRPANIVQPKYKFSMRRGVCSSGIHFFLEHEQAVKYAT